MRVIVFSTAWNMEVDVSGWMVATGQCQAVVYQHGEDGHHCKVMF